MVACGLYSNSCASGAHAPMRVQEENSKTASAPRSPPQDMLSRRDVERGITSLVRNLTAPNDDASTSTHNVRHHSVLRAPQGWPDAGPRKEGWPCGHVEHSTARCCRRWLDAATRRSTAPSSALPRRTRATLRSAAELTAVLRSLASCISGIGNVSDAPGDRAAFAGTGGRSRGA